MNYWAALAAKKLGVFWKIQDICCKMATDIFKLKEERTEKIKPEVARHKKINFVS